MEGDLMPRTKEQNETMREVARVKIHSAAIKLFSQKGFAAAGVQEIYDTANISMGLVYRHYKTKDDIDDIYTIININRFFEYMTIIYFFLSGLFSKTIDLDMGVMDVMEHG